MPISNPFKTVDKTKIKCGETFNVTIGFDAEAELKSTPTDVVLIMDKSGSMAGEPMVKAKAAAKEFIRTFTKASGSTDGKTIENGSLMTIVSFSETAERKITQSNDAVALLADIDALSATTGRTSHSAAFSSAENVLSKSTLARKAVVMFTDGKTTVGPDPKDYVERLKKNNVEIFCIGLLTDPEPLNRWSSDPDSTYVATTDDVNQLEKVFSKIASEVVLAGAKDVKIVETLNPDFKINSLSAPSHGVASVISPQKLEWTMGAAGSSGLETASLTFNVTHVGSTGGMMKVNESIVYSDRDGNTLQFPDPQIEVSCDSTAVYPESCPVPVSFTTDACKDFSVAEVPSVKLQSLGRIVQVNATVRNLCPGKKAAAAIILTEEGPNGEEYNRGVKMVELPVLTGDKCQDVTLKCVDFVVPESMDATGDTDSICNERKFKARVMVNYVDTDFVCCDANTVII